MCGKSIGEVTASLNGGLGEEDVLLIRCSPISFCPMKKKKRHEKWVPKEKDIRYTYYELLKPRGKKK
jgi:hypothetical protein